jgi:hypothetical protein
MSRFVAPTVPLVVTPEAQETYKNLVVTLVNKGTPQNQAKKIARSSVMSMLAEERKAKEAQEREAIRAKVASEVAVYLQSTTVEIDGFGVVSGVKALALHLAFGPLQGTRKNPHVPTNTGSSVVASTWAFVRELQIKFGGVENFPIEPKALKAVLLSADRQIDENGNYVSGYFDKSLNKSNDPFDDIELDDELL